jgi:hypothetical protein
MAKELQLSVVIEFYYNEELTNEIDKLRQQEQPKMDLETFAGYQGYNVIKEIMDSEYQCMDGESYIIGTKVKIVEKNT